MYTGDGMDKFCIITNPDKDKNYEMTRQITRYLGDHGKECFIASSLLDEYDNYYTDSTTIPEGTECAIVLGGDALSFKLRMTWSIVEYPFLELILVR